MFRVLVGLLVHTVLGNKKSNLGNLCRKFVKPMDPFLIMHVNIYSEQWMGSLLLALFRVYVYNSLYARSASLVNWSSFY